MTAARSRPLPRRAAGFPDLLPGRATLRRGLSSEVLETFTAWGYDEVHTPMVEPLETIATGLGAAGQDRLIRFADSDGSMLALVGERTVSVARVVATQLHDQPVPLRLCYAGAVLHQHLLHGGRRRELMQAGCELIGSDELAADAECIALAVQALDHAGLAGVQVDVGHAGFLPGLLLDAGIDSAQREQVLGALAARNLVAVEEALAETAMGEVERSLLLQFPALRGGADLLAAAADGLRAPRAHAALNELRVLWDMLEAHGVAAQAHIDLGAVRDWDYYTGPIFELFTPDVGFALGAGGRYDRLLARFGSDVPATGFVLFVDRCCDALERAQQVPGTAQPVQVSHTAGAAVDAYDAARRLRAAGLRASCRPRPCEQLEGGSDLHLTADGGAHWHDGDAVRAGTVDEAVAAFLVASLR